MKHFITVSLALCTMAVGWIFYEVHTLSKQAALIEKDIKRLKAVTGIIAEHSPRKSNIIKVLMKSKKQ